MPRQVSVSVENNFSRALITEATGLNFPENACTETYDCVFGKTGEVTRRLGIQLEDGYSVHQIDAIADSAITEYLWRSVSLNGEITFLVLQIGRLINFFQVDTDGLVSPTLKDFSVNLDTYKTSGSPAIADVHASFAGGNGHLYIAHPYCTSLQIEYDVEDDDIEIKTLDLLVRDMSGVSNSLLNDGDPDGGDPIDASVRPTTLSSNILYNLLNQGWDAIPAFRLNKHVFGGSTPLLKVWREGVKVFPSGIFSNPFQVLEAKHALGRNDWPSEADIWSVYKRPIIPVLDENGNPVNPNFPDEGFALDATDDEELGNSPAPKGHYIYDAFNIDRWTKMQSGVTYSLFPQAFVGMTPNQIESSGYARPSQIAFYAGRVWYAGVDASRYNTRIYFSWIVENNLHSEKCYQRNDPTAADGPSTDLLPSDGGVIVIPDLARVVKLVPYGNSLLVFGTNGIWQIAGSAQGAGFNATDYGVVKIASSGAISFLSFVDVDGTPLWWNSDGIYSIKQEQGLPMALSLTNNTIQTFFDDIPVINRRYVKGFYNPATKIVQWLYRSTEFTNIQERYTYDRILNLDLNTGAMYPWTISDACVYVAGLTVLSAFGTTGTQEAVTDDAVAVTDGGDAVTDTALTLADIEPRFKYLVFNECDDVDPGEEDTEASLTYNKNFLGETDSGDFTPGNYDAAWNAVIVGEDGKYYIPSSTSSQFGTGTNQRAVLQQYDAGTGTIVNYTIAQQTLDILATTGVNNDFGTPGTPFSTRGIIPVPFTQYFYMCSYARNAAANFYLTFGLYKVNSSGAIVFMNAGHAYTAHFNTAFAANGIVAVDYESDTQADPLNRTVLVLISDATANPFILRMPSVNTFTSTTGTVGAIATLHTGFTAASIYDIGGSSYNSEQPTNGSAFFLPTDSGALVCRYVDAATCKAHIDNHLSGQNSALIDSFAATCPTGFVMASPITGASWSVINTSFKDVNGNTLIPFSDVYKDRDEVDPGFASGNYLNDWLSPTHQYDVTNDVHYLVWTRRYRNVEANQTSIGTYRKVLVQTWNPATQIATAQADATGGPYDTVADLGGSGTRYGSYPRMSQSYLDTDFNEVLMYSVYDGSSAIVPTTNALAKFGDFTPAVIADVPEGTMSFAEFSNGDYSDWTGVTAGSDYTSYFISGYKLRGEAIRKFQSNYMNVYTRNSDPSTFDVNGRWDYAASGNTGRWNTTQRVTMEDTNYSYRTKRLKMRGHGKALQFKVSSVSGEPFNIIGWSLYESVNSAP